MRYYGNETKDRSGLTIYDNIAYWTSQGYKLERVTLEFDYAHSPSAWTVNDRCYTLEFSK